MKLNFINRIMLLSASIAALSCSVEDFPKVEETDSNTIIASGAVSDRSTGEALEGIIIHLYAVENTTDGEVEHIKHGYTNSQGYFTITSNGFSNPVSCTITTEDPSGIYESEQQEMNISWQGISYDKYNRCFYVNDCNFYLRKKAEAN